MMWLVDGKTAEQVIPLVVEGAMPPMKIFPGVSSEGEVMGIDWIFRILTKMLNLR